MSDKSWILKILSGSHVGAEVILSDKEAILGRDESCDLVLEDVSLSARHISLRSSPSGAHLTLLDMAKPVYIDGEELTEEEALLEPFQVIMIGTLFIAAGPADEEWPAIDLLLKNKISPRPSDDEKQESDDDTEADLDEKNAAHAAETSSELSAQKTFPWVYSIVIGIPVIALLGLLASWLLLPDKHKHTTTQPEQAEQIMQIAKKYDAVINIKTADAEGEFSEITGYVSTEAKRTQLLEQLEKIDVHAHVKIVAAEKIESAISSIINEFLAHNEDAHVEVNAVEDSPGDFILHGYVKDETKWLKVVATLKRDIKDYRNLQNNVQTQRDRVEILRQMLNDAHLGRTVNIAETGQGVVLSGNLNKEEKERLMQIKQGFNREFNSQPLATWVLEKSEQDTAPSIKLDIRGIRFGDNPQIITRDGQHYGEGTQLDNGYTINNITTNLVVLKKGDKTEYLHLDAMR